MSESNLKYHKYIIKSAPYGELDSVITNLQKLSSFDTDSEEVRQILREYNEQHVSLVEQKQNVFFPIFGKARDTNGYYVDQLNKRKLKINHLTKQIEQQQEVELQLPEPVIELLETLSKKVQNYVQTFYRESSSSQVFMQITEEGSLEVHVVFTAKNAQLNNFYTGQWLSTWKINKDKIEGSVSVRSHFYESGNVQMNQNKNLDKEFQFTADMEQNATKIIKTIEAFDSEIQKGLDTVYEQMPTGFFKNLRRLVPVTKTKMIWNVNSLKMNQNLLKTKK